MFDADEFERVAVELAEVEAALVDVLVLLDCVEAVLVLLMLRVPDNWLAFDALVPLFIVEERDSKDWFGF